MSPEIFYQIKTKETSMKIHSEQLFNYLESRGFKLTEEDKANILEIILFGKNDKGKYSQQREESFGG